MSEGEAAERESRPTEEPPGGEEAPAGGEPPRPQELTPEELELTRREPGEEPTAEPAAGAVTRQQDKRVNALWSSNEPRNAWLSFTDLGWRRIMPSTESGVIALTMLAAHAKQTQCRVDFSEDGNVVVSAYCWR